MCSPELRQIQNYQRSEHVFTPNGFVLKQEYFYILNMFCTPEWSILNEWDIFKTSLTTHFSWLYQSTFLINSYDV